MKKLFLSLMLALSLAACGGGNSHSVPVIGPDGQPTGQTVQQPDGPGVGTGAVLGGLAGYMLGRSASSGGGGGGYHPGYQQPTTVINKTVVNKTVINKAPTTVQKAPIPSYTKPSGSAYSRPSTQSYSRPSVPSYRGGRR